MKKISRSESFYAFVCDDLNFYCAFQDEFLNFSSSSHLVTFACRFRLPMFDKWVHFLSEKRQKENCLLWHEHNLDLICKITDFVIVLWLLQFSKEKRMKIFLLHKFTFLWPLLSSNYFFFNDTLSKVKYCTRKRRTLWNYVNFFLFSSSPPFVVSEIRKRWQSFPLGIRLIKFKLHKYLQTARRWNEFLIRQIRQKISQEAA